MSKHTTKPASVGNGKQQKVGRKAAKLSLTTADDRRRVQHEVDQPYKSIDKWDGSETFQLLSEPELACAAEHLGDGNHSPGLFILLLEHLAKLAFEKRFHDLECAVSQVTKEMATGGFGPRQQVESLRDKDRQELAELTTWLLSLRASDLTERLYKHIEDVDEKARARKESAAA